MNVGRVLDACVAAIEQHADELTELDQAIGDGDHGINMRRGFRALAEQRDALAGLPPATALQKAGMILVMKVGGASGPLYGSLLMAMGKALGDGAIAPKGLSAALNAGIEAVRKRGKSDRGEKTMLDVLMPAADALGRGIEDRLGARELADRVRAAAASGVETAKALQATKGRAAYLGARSVGHVDPGSRSCQILIEIVGAFADTAASSSNRA